MHHSFSETMEEWKKKMNNGHNMYIFNYPSTWEGYDPRSIFKWSLIGLNSELSFSLNSEFSFPKIEETSLFCYLPLAGGRITGFMHFLRLCELQTVLSRIWTWVTMSISFDYIHYTLIASSCWHNMLTNFFILLKNISSHTRCIR